MGALLHVVTDEFEVTAQVARCLVEMALLLGTLGVPQERLGDPAVLQAVDQPVADFKHITALHRASAHRFFRTYPSRSDRVVTDHAPLGARQNGDGPFRDTLATVVGAREASPW